MELIKLMQKRSDRIENVKEDLFELETDLIGAEVRHEDKEAMIMEIDWMQKAVLLNYDDVNMEWITF
ncbi:hypothetical protein [Aquibacillus saliphilus]|uniref:hypothetical protein n=1 Tax=Aquibacillus saliphilus TaxID=1909422 RepID=UPI001CF08170|nr:hypothetical protein [Aquibacillus saliphilus]